MSRRTAVKLQRSIRGSTASISANNYEFVAEKDIDSTKLEESSALVNALASTGKFPHEARDIRVVETHISWVLLTGAYAYKIKKPVDLGFLDFTSLDKRRHFCEEELRLNSRFSADLYIDVVDIGGSPDAPVVDAKQGPTLEYAVRMHEFPADALLSRQIVQAQLSVADMSELGTALAQLHAAAPVAGADSEFGSPPAVIAPMHANFQALESTCPWLSADGRFGALREWTRAEGERLQPLLTARKAAGYIRECHGDLHLGNLVRWRGKIMPFDCLEFDPGLRWIDVMNEVAFLFMDTIEHGREDLAYAFLNRYLSESGDYEGLNVFRLYIVYRALVRAKVRALSLRDGSRDDEELNAYLELADRWTGPAAPPIMVATHGMSGSGKTVISTMLMTALPAVRLRSDRERKRLHGLAEFERTDSGVGAGLYDRKSGQRTYERLADLARNILSAGFNVIVDAAFLDHERRDVFTRLADESGCAHIWLSCEAPDPVLRERVAQRDASGKDASEADLAVLTHQLENCRPLTDEEDALTVHVDTRDSWSGELLARTTRRKLELAGSSRKT